MGAAAILQIRMPNGKPFEELGILNFELVAYGDFELFNYELLGCALRF